MSLNRDDVVASLAEKTGIMKKDIREILEALPEIIRAAVVTYGSLRYSGLGTFSLVKRAARQGRDPRTGEPLAIPAKNSLKFKPHSGFLKTLKSLGNPAR